MKGGTVKSNKKKTSFQGKSQGASFGNQKGAVGGGWQGMGKKSILSQLKTQKKKGDVPDQA